jgi:uncharacterized protein YaiL (DUF2058 family)
MSKSLQEQLLKAGLGNAKKLTAIKKEKHKERVQAGKKGVVVNEASVLAEQNRQAQILRDQELNRQKTEALAKKALAAQVKQIIELNSLSYKGDIAFNFTDGNLVKRIHVSALVQQQLIKGLIAIAKLNEHYHLIPIQVAEKVQQRQPDAILVLNQKDEQLPEDDPYADFKIPDDLMW